MKTIKELETKALTSRTGVLKDFEYGCLRTLKDVLELINEWNEPCLPTKRFLLAKEELKARILG